MRKFSIVLFVAAVFFVAGVLVGRFVMPRKVTIMMVDIKDLVEIIERYNEMKHELDRIRGWNEDAIIESEPEEETK